MFVRGQWQTPSTIFASTDIFGCSWPHRGAPGTRASSVDTRSEIVRTNSGGRLKAWLSAVRFMSRQGNTDKDSALPGREFQYLKSVAAPSSVVRRPLLEGRHVG